MLEPWPPADVSVLEELFAIQKERKVLAERLERLEEERPKIHAVVFERVHRDYETQSRRLVERAAPLKERARRGHAEVVEALAHTEEKLENAQLDRQELELRHRLGELGEEDFQTRLGKAEELIQALERDLAEIGEVKTSFIAVFDSEEELTQAPAPTELTVATPSEPVPALPAPVAEEPLPPPPPLPTPTPDPFEDELDETHRLQKEALADTGPLEGSAEAGATVVIASTNLPPPLPLGGTMLLKPARLIPEEALPGISELHVEPLTTIGRTDQNQIQINDATVSRRHACIVLGEDGYVIEDMGSENGTFVNGQRVTRQVLADGDRVQIGTVRLVFKKT